MYLGVNVLKISEDEILIALNDKKGIQSATQTVIRSWLKKQFDRHEAYNTLYRELQSNDMNVMAAVLKESVEGTVTQVDLSPERKQPVLHYPTVANLPCSANFFSTTLWAPKREQGC